MLSTSIMHHKFSHVCRIVENDKKISINRYMDCDFNKWRSSNADYGAYHSKDKKLCIKSKLGLSGGYSICILKPYLCGFGVRS